MRRKPIKKRSSRGKILDRLDALQFTLLKLRRGAKCEICGGTKCLGTFHILPKRPYVGIRYHEFNLLIAGWYCCHHPFHHDYYVARDRIVPRIKELRGEDYEDKLHGLDVMASRMSAFQLSMIEISLKQEIKKEEK